MQKASLEAGRGSPILSSNRKSCSFLVLVGETGLGKKCIVNSFVNRGQRGVGGGCEQVPPRKLSTEDAAAGPSPLLSAHHAVSHPTQRVNSSQVSRRGWSHDLDLANQHVRSSLATVIGSGVGY